MSDQKNFTRLSFTEVKEDLKSFLKSQDRFKDYNFDGSNMSVLLDVLAYNTFKQNIYNNMSISERFLDTAQTKNAVVSHAKELNYLPQSMRSAQARIELRLNASDSPDYVTLPKGTVFTSRDGSTVYEFVTDQAYTITPTDGSYRIEIPILEGKMVKEHFPVEKKSSQYRISNPNVDTSSITVKVSPSKEIAQEDAGDEYILMGSLHGASKDSKVFYLQPSENDTYQVEFGRNVFGIEPEIGEVVTIEYRITEGVCGNGAKQFSLKTPINGYGSSVITKSPAGGGACRENIESIRFFAPKALQIQDRAVTERDYELLLRQRFPEIQAVSAYGGEEASPPQYGRVIISVDVKNAEGVSNALKETYRNYLKDRTPLGIEPVIMSPLFMFASVNTTVYYDNRESSMSSAEVKERVQRAIKQYSDSTLNNFNSTIRHSKLTSVIDNTHPSIKSNMTTIRAVIEVVPYEGKFFNTYINFGNRIIKEPTVSVNNFDTNRVPGIVTSSFRHRNRTCFIRDNGEGKLQIVTVSNGIISTVDSDIGSIDYETGKVSIRSFAVQSYIGTGISFFATTYYTDFKAPKDRILAIRDSDINVNVEWVN